MIKAWIDVIKVEYNPTLPLHTLTSIFQTLHKRLKLSLNVSMQQGIKQLTKTFFNPKMYPVSAIYSAAGYMMPAYLFLFGVQLKALGKWAGLRLQVLLLYLTHTFSIRDVFIFSPFEQTVGRTWNKSQRHHVELQKTFTLCISVQTHALKGNTSALSFIKCVWIVLQSMPDLTY